MRCKKHVTDLSSAVGVCASCLRERLFTIIAAQVQKQQAHAAAAAAANANANTTAVLHHHHDSRNSDGHHRQPPPLLFPRSVSPYISRRKSDTSATWQQRFYSTPLVCPTGSVEITNSDNKKDKKKKKKSGFIKSLFFGLFRSKSDKMDPKRDPGPDPRYGDRGDICGASPAWFRKQQLRTFSADDSRRPQPPRRCYDRGMSPARYSDEEEGGGGSSGYSSESSQGWRQTPRRTTTPAAEVRRRGRGRGLGHGMNVSSGLAFCLSPLVRASPSRNWNQKGLPPDMVESRAPAPAKKLSSAASFCKNRSRKLADFGRYSYNYNTSNN